MTKRTKQQELAQFAALVRIATEVTASSTIMEPSHRESSLTDYAWQRDLTADGSIALASLRQLQRDLLVPWNESVGADVERFWQGVACDGLQVTRKDVVVETLKRGRILNMQHYSALEERYEELQECEKLSPAQADELGRMFDAFENNPKNKACFY